MSLNKSKVLISFSSEVLNSVICSSELRRLTAFLRSLILPLAIFSDFANTSSAFLGLAEHIFLANYRCILRAIRE